MPQKITVTAQINAPVEKVWEFYNNPEHVKQWNNASNGMTDVEVTFDPEGENEPEFQRQGWQSILDNFKQYVESHH